MTDVACWTHSARLPRARHRPIRPVLQGGARFVGDYSLDEAVSVTVDVASHPGRLVFLYVPFVDLAAHMHGQASREYAEALSLADTIWGRLCTSPDPLYADRLPDGVLFPDPGWTVFARS